MSDVTITSEQLVSGSDETLNEVTYSDGTTIFVPIT